MPKAPPRQDVDADLKKDGFRSLELGMNSSLYPVLIPRNQAAMAVNATFRGGFIGPRPGVKKVPLTFLDQNGAPDTTLQLNFQNGFFQGADAFALTPDNPCLMAVISGRVFKINLTRGFSVQDISIPGDLNPNNVTQIWSLQAEGFWLMNDNTSGMFIYNGAQARRALPGELPPGGPMAYVMGRIWEAMPDGLSFLAGDVVGGPSGTSAYNFKDAILKATENDYLNEGGTFSVPAELGPITAITRINILDTSLGQGPVMVGTPTAIFSVNAPPDRTTWKNLTYPIQTVALEGYGPLAQKSTVKINSDVWYRSLDGMRSFQIARQQMGQWGNTPQSGEVDNILDADDKTWLPYGSSIVFQNRLLETCSPFYSTHGICHRGLTSLDFDLITNLSEQLGPAYDGLWVFASILQLVKTTINGAEHAYAFIVNQAGAIELYELTVDEMFDNGRNPIAWSFETGSYDFTNPDRLKWLETAYVWRRDVTGPQTMHVLYRPDQYAGWIDWVTFSDCANYVVCLPATPKCSIPLMEQPQYRPRLRLPGLNNYPADSIVNKPFSFAYQFQLRFEHTGFSRYNMLEVRARDQQEAEHGGNFDPTQCFDLQMCTVNPFTYNASGTVRITEEGDIRGTEDGGIRILEN